MVYHLVKIDLMVCVHVITDHGILLRIRCSAVCRNHSETRTVGGHGILYWNHSTVCDGLLHHIYYIMILVLWQHNAI